MTNPLLAPLATPNFKGAGPHCVGVGATQMATMQDLQDLWTGWQNSLLQTIQANVTGGALTPISTGGGTAIDLVDSVSIQTAQIHPGWIFGHGALDLTTLGLNPTSAKFKDGSSGAPSYVAYQGVESLQHPNLAALCGPTWEARFLEVAFSGSNCPPFWVWGNIVANGLKVVNSQLLHDSWTMTLRIMGPGPGVVPYCPNGGYPNPMPDYYDYPLYGWNLIAPAMGGGSGIAGGFTDLFMWNYLNFSMEMGEVTVPGRANPYLLPGIGLKINGQGGPAVFTGDNGHPPESIDLTSGVYGPSFLNLGATQLGVPAAFTTGTYNAYPVFLNYRGGPTTVFDPAPAQAWASAHGGYTLPTFEQMFPNRPIRKSSPQGLTVFSILSKV